MRTLTIRREKKFTGLAATASFYMEDKENPETFIDAIPCRKLGELKNGEEKTFEIPEDAVRIVVGPPSGLYHGRMDVAELPEGAEPQTLSGRIIADSAGGAFRFDGPNGKPKKSNAAGLVKMIALPIVIGVVIGLLISIPNLIKLLPKTFKTDEISVTVTRQFEEYEEEGFDIALDSNVAMVLGMKEDLSDLDGFQGLTAEEYADMWNYANGLGEPELNHRGDMVLCEFDKGEFHAYVFTLKNGDTFWTFQFAILAEKQATMESRVMKWADSITILK